MPKIGVKLKWLSITINCFASKCNTKLCFGINSVYERSFKTKAVISNLWNGLPEYFHMAYIYRQEHISSKKDIVLDTTLQNLMSRQEMNAVKFITTLNMHICLSQRKKGELYSRIALTCSFLFRVLTKEVWALCQCQEESDMSSKFNHH